MDEEIRKLSELAAMLKERELAALGNLARKREICRKAVDDCRAARAAALAQAAPDAAHLSGMAEPWLRANADRLCQLTAELAQNAAEVEEQGMRARRAFGRAQALSKLEMRKG